MMEGYISNTILVASFWAHDNYYSHIYYFGDWIYLEFSIIVKTFKDLINEKKIILRKYKSLCVRTLRDVLGFFNNVGVLLKIHVAFGHWKE